MLHDQRQKQLAQKQFNWRRRSTENSRVKEMCMTTTREDDDYEGENVQLALQTSTFPTRADLFAHLIHSFSMVYLWFRRRKSQMAKLWRACCNNVKASDFCCDKRCQPFWRPQELIPTIAIRSSSSCMAQYLPCAPEMKQLEKVGKRMKTSFLQPQYFEDGCPLQFGVNSGEITSVIWKPWKPIYNLFALDVSVAVLDWSWEDVIHKRLIWWVAEDRSLVQLLIQSQPWLKFFVFLLCACTGANSFAIIMSLDNNVIQM